jgi:serine protease Do
VRLLLFRTRRWRLTSAAAAIALASSAIAGECAQSTPDLIASLQPAVVNLSITKHTKTGDGGNVAGQTSITERKAFSSGFFIDPTGVIVTNRHVIADATEIIATLHDGTRLTARMLSSAARIDLALLKVNAGKPVPSLRFGDSDRLRTGDPVLVIGNPVGLGSTVTAGIVSALDRITPESEVGSFFQVDAPLNMGNSGGPVFNMEGEVIGVSTAFATAGNEGGSVGLGFAIPSTETQMTINRLKTDGRDSFGWIGVHVQPVTDDIAAAVHMPTGMTSIITRVDGDSPAARTGLDSGDIIVKISDEDMPEPRRAARKIAGSAVGSIVQIAILRDGKQLTFPVTIAEFPGNDAKSAPASAVAPEEPPIAARDLGLELAPLTSEVRARLGMTDQDRGVLVEHVKANSAASDRGIAAGSVIVKVGRIAVTSPAEAQQRLQDAGISDRGFILVLIRDEQGLRWTALPLKPA